MIPCGLFIRSDYYLAVTPDGLVGDNAIVEVKCPYTGINSMIEPSPMCGNARHRPVSKEISLLL